MSFYDENYYGACPMELSSPPLTFSEEELADEIFGAIERQDEDEAYRLLFGDDGSDTDTEDDEEPIPVHERRILRAPRRKQAPAQAAQPAHMQGRRIVRARRGQHVAPATQRQAHLQLQAAQPAQPAYMRGRKIVKAKRKTGRTN